MVLDDGYIRDTVLFSIVQPEWPQIKLSLQSRLEKLSKENINQ
jgi:hypothetical protein